MGLRVDGLGFALGELRGEIRCCCSLTYVSPSACRIAPAGRDQAVAFVARW